jgi:hypothetical protein
MKWWCVIFSYCGQWHASQHIFRLRCGQPQHTRCVSKERGFRWLVYSYAKCFHSFTRCSLGTRQSSGLPQREKRPQGLTFSRFTRSVISTPWFARCLSSQVFAPLSSSYFSLCPWVLLNVAWPPMGFTPIAFTSRLLTTTWPPGIALFPVSSPPRFSF